MGNCIVKCIDGPKQDENSDIEEQLQIGNVKRKKDKKEKVDFKEKSDDEGDIIMTCSTTNNYNPQNTYTPNHQNTDYAHESIISFPSEDPEKGDFDFKEFNMSYIGNDINYDENEFSTISNVNKFDAVLDNKKNANLYGTNTNNLKAQKLLLNQNTRFTVVYIEIMYLMIYNKDETQNSFSDLNLLFLIEFNDDKSTQEKIPLEIKENTKDSIKLCPQYKKGEKHYKFSRALHLEQKKDEIVKVKIMLANFSKDKMFFLSEDSVFFKCLEEQKQHKFQQYMNILGSINKKKLGNVLFNMSYDFKTDLKGGFPVHDKIAQMKIDPTWEFNYYFIENHQIKEVKNENNFISINDICEVDYTEELKKDVSLKRLIEMLKNCNKTFDLYCILQKLVLSFGKMEFTPELLSLFKNYLTLKLEALMDNENCHDLMNIPLIYFCLRYSLFGKSSKNKDKKKKEKRLEELSKDDSTLYLKNFVSTISLIITFVKNYNKIKSKVLGSEKEKPTIYSKLIFTLLSFLSCYFEELFFMNLDNKMFNSMEFYSDLIVKNNFTAYMFIIITLFSDKHECVYPNITILSKVLATKKQVLDDMCKIISKKESLAGFKNIFLNLYDNSTYLNDYINFFMNFKDALTLQDLISVISFKSINSIFSMYKVNLLPLHENFINFIKHTLQKKQGLQEKEISAIFTNDSYSEIIHVFCNFLILVFNKLRTMETKKIYSWLFKCLSFINTIANIVVNINPNNIAIVNKVSFDRRMPELFVEIFYQLYEKKILLNIDSMFKPTDFNLLTTKTLLFRTMYHIVIQINNLYSEKKNFPSASAKKLYLYIKHIEDNDEKFSPSDMVSIFKKDNKLDSVASEHLNTLNQYYSRYKQVLEEKNFINLLTDIIMNGEK